MWNRPVIALSLTLMTLTADRYAHAAESRPVHSLAVPPPAHVFLGGLHGMPSLAEPRATAQLRHTSKAGLYIHWYSTEEQFSHGSLPAVEHVFGNSRNCIAEVNIFDAGFFKTEWVDHIRHNGFDPSTVTVNIDASEHPDPIPAERVSNFERFVDEGRQEGVQIVAPFVSPNGSMSVSHKFADPWWDRQREMALYGGGIAFDSPPAFFLYQRPPAEIAAYQTFTADALVWAHSHNLYAVMVLSPRFDGGHFLQNARRVYEILLARQALPDAWVIENYDADPTLSPTKLPSFGTPMAPDSQPETQAGVALWFARYAKVWRSPARRASVVTH